MTLNLLLNSTLEKVRASTNYLYRNPAASSVISSSSSVGEEIQLLRRGKGQPCLQEKRLPRKGRLIGEETRGGLIVEQSRRGLLGKESRGGLLGEESRGGSFLSKPWSSLSLCYRSFHLSSGSLDHKPKNAPRSAGSNSSQKSQPDRRLETRLTRSDKPKFIDMKSKGPSYTRTKMYDSPPDRGLGSSLANFQNPLIALGFQSTYKKLKKYTYPKKIASREETSKSTKNQRLLHRNIQKNSSTKLEGKENVMVSSDKILNMRPLYWQKSGLTSTNTVGNGGHLEKIAEVPILQKNGINPNKSRAKQMTGHYSTKKESPLKASRTISKVNVTKEKKNQLYQTRLEVSSNTKGKTKEKLSPLIQTRKDSSYSPNQTRKDSSYAMSQTRTDNFYSPNQTRNESSYTPNGTLSAENANVNKSNKGDSLASNILAEKMAQLKKDTTAKPNGNPHLQIFTEEQVPKPSITLKKGGTGHDVSNKKIWPPLYEKKESTPISNVTTNNVKTAKEKKFEIPETKNKIHAGASVHSKDAPEIMKENDGKISASGLEEELKSARSLAGNESTNNKRVSDKEDNNTKNKNSLLDNAQNFDKADVSKKNMNEPATKWPPIYARIKSPDKSKSNESTVKYNNISSEHPKRKHFNKQSSDSQKKWPPLYAKRKQSEDTASKKSSTPFDQYNKIKLYTKSVEIPVAAWKPRRQVLSVRNGRIKSKGDLSSQALEPSKSNIMVGSPSKTSRAPPKGKMTSKTDLQHVILMRRKNKKYQMADIYDKNLFVTTSKGNLRRSLSSFLASKKKHLTLVLKEEINKWKRVENVTREINQSKSSILRAITHNTDMKNQYNFSEPTITGKMKNNSSERSKIEAEEDVTRNNSVTIVPLTKSCFYIKGKKSPVTSRKDRNVMTYNKNLKKPLLLTELEKSPKKQISSGETETGRLSFSKVVNDPTKILESNYRKKLLKQIPPPGNDTIRHTYSKPPKMGSPKTPSNDKVIKDEDVPEVIRGLTKFSALTKEKTDDLNSLSVMTDEMLLPLKRHERRHARTALSSAGSKSTSGQQTDQNKSMTKQCALPVSNLKTGQPSTTNVSYYPSSYSIQPNLIVQVIPTQNRIMLIESRNDGNSHTKEPVQHSPGGKGGNGGGGLCKSVCIGSSKDLPIQNKYSMERSLRRKEMASIGKVMASLDEHNHKFISIPSTFNKDCHRQPADCGTTALNIRDKENAIAKNDNVPGSNWPVKQLPSSSEAFSCPSTKLKATCESGLMLVEECRAKDFESPLDSEFVIKYDFEEDLNFRTTRSGAGGFVLVNSGEESQKKKRGRPQTPTPYALSDLEISDKIDRLDLPKVAPTLKLPSPEESKEKSTERDPATDSPKNEMRECNRDSENTGLLGRSPILNLCKSDLKSGNALKSSYEPPKDEGTSLSFPSRVAIQSPKNHHPESWATRYTFLPSSGDFKKDPILLNKDNISESASKEIPHPLSPSHLLSQKLENAVQEDRSSMRSEAVSEKLDKPCEVQKNTDLISGNTTKEHKNVGNKTNPQIVVKQDTLLGESPFSVSVGKEQNVFASKQLQQQLNESKQDSLTSKMGEMENKENSLILNEAELGQIVNPMEGQLTYKNIRIETTRNGQNMIIQKKIGITDNIAQDALKKENIQFEEEETIISSDPNSEKRKDNASELPQTEVVCNGQDQSHNGTFEEYVENLKLNRTEDLSSSIPRTLAEDMSNRENLIRYSNYEMYSEELKKAILESDSKRLNQFDNQRYFYYEKQNKTYKDYKSKSNEFSENRRTSLGLDVKDPSTDGVFQKLVNFCKAFSPFKGPGLHQSSPDLRSEFNATKRRHYSPFDGVEVLQPLKKTQATNGKEMNFNCKRYRALDVVEKLAQSEKDNVLREEEIHPHEEASKVIPNNHILNSVAPNLDENRKMTKKQEQDICGAPVHFSSLSRKNINRNILTSDIPVKSWNNVKDHLKQKYSVKKKSESRIELDKIDGTSAKKVLSAVRVRSQIRKTQKPKKNVKSTTYLDIPIGKLMKSLSDQVSFTSKQPNQVGAKGSLTKPILKQKPTFMKDNSAHKFANVQPKPMICKKPQKMKNILNKLTKSMNEIPEEFVVSFDSVPSRVVEPIHVLDRTFQSNVLTAEMKQTIFPFYNPESYWQDSALIKDNTVFSNSTPSLNNIYLNYIKRERLT